MCDVVEFYSRDAWYVATLTDKPVVLARSETDDRGHPGVCPVTSFMQYESDPLFSGQIGLEVAVNKLLSQEIQHADQMLHGPIFHSPVVGGNMRWDQPNIFDTTFGDRPYVQRLAPNSPMNTERVLGSIIGLARVLNRNPESFQGGGDANSAKAIQTLQSGIRSTVQDILWKPFLIGFPRAYDNCLEMELNLWPNEKKKAYGTKGKQSFEVDYTPSVHLPNFKGRIRIEKGFGLGGYQQTLDALQRMGAGAMPLEDFLEMDPDVRDVRETLTKLSKESLEKVADAMFEQKAATLSFAGLARVYELVEEGKTKFEAIRIADQEGVLEPPVPEAPEAGMPILPPGMAPPDIGLPPSLAEARGF